ncbi:hypothetical protein [Psychrobacter sp. 16-MNA-CIBAN-0192]|uniref:hypothetical protein n=1 Tax=Psychrobacter sp. 16-MNA-CIBAN-0192 TaxID=3140448 RepID=UPI0033238CAE
MKKLALYLVVGATLLGCGSDDSRPGVMPGLPSGGTGQPTTPNQGGSTPNQPPTDSNTPPAFPDGTQTEAKLLSGIYSGTSTDVTGKSYVLNGLVDDNENLWFIHANSDKGDILGFTNSNTNIRGSNGSFTVKGVEYSYEDRIANPITIEGDYTTANMVIGKTYDNLPNATNYSVKYNEKLSSQKQSLSMLDSKTFMGDTYMTDDDGKARGTVVFSNKGSFIGQVERCKMSGNLTLAGSGRYFKASVKFASSDCLANGETHTGVALINEDGGLILLGTNGAKNRGIFFDGDLK